MFDDLGYPKDVVSGKLFERHQGIEAEWMQRAKILTHEFRRQLREERERKTVEEFEEKQNKLRHKIDELIQLNKETEQMLKEQIAVRLHGNLLHTCNNNSNESLLMNATLEMIKGLTVPYMKAFIRVQLSPTKSISKDEWNKVKIKSRKFPNKGSIEEAKNALNGNTNHNLISLCYSCLSLKVLMV